MRKFICFLLLYSFSSLSYSQCECLNDPWIQQTGVGGSNIIVNCSSNAGNEWCHSNAFDGPMEIDQFTSEPFSDWMLIIDEEFNNSFDSTIWYSRMPWSNNDADNGYPGVTSLEIPDNISVNNGLLHLRGKYDNSSVLYDVWSGNNKLPVGEHRDFTSGCISSKYQFPLNSRYQVAAKMFPDPNTTASGIWLYGNNNQEIDLLENVDNYDNLPSNGNRQYMGVHGNLYGGSGSQLADYTFIDHAEDLTQSINQYDLIWDKWKAEFWFNGSIEREVCKYYYCPCPWYWSSTTVDENIRENPIVNFNQASLHVGDKFAVAKYFPDYSPMTLIIGMAPDGGTPNQYNDLNADGSAVNTLDIESIKVWLRADCSSDVSVTALNWLNNSQWDGTAYEMGKTVSTVAGANILITNFHKGVFAATEEIALLDGFGTETGSGGFGANFHAFITYCQSAWDNRDADSNPLRSQNIYNLNNELTSINAKQKDSISMQVNISPNPSCGLFTLEGTLKDMPGQVYVSLYDLQGNIIKQEAQYNLGDKINLTFLSSGVYNIQIRSNSSTIQSGIKKLVIVK